LPILALVTIAGAFSLVVALASPPRFYDMLSMGCGVVAIWLSPYREVSVLG